MSATNVSNFVNSEKVYYMNERFTVPTLEQVIRQLLVDALNSMVPAFCLIDQTRMRMIFFPAAVTGGFREGLHGYEEIYRFMTQELIDKCVNLSGPLLHKRMYNIYMKPICDGNEIIHINMNTLNKDYAQVKVKNSEGIYYKLVRKDYLLKPTTKQTVTQFYREMQANFIEDNPATDALYCDSSKKSFAGNYKKYMTKVAKRIE